MSVKDIERKITQLSKELEEEKQKLNDLQGMSQPIRVAEMLHDKTCHLDHNDMCGWYYEDWDNWKTTYAKKHYMEKAFKIIDLTNGDEEFIENFIDALQGH